MKLSPLVACSACALLLSLPTLAQKAEERSASPAAGTSAAAGGGAPRRGVPLLANQTREQFFDGLDSNRSGTVSRAEAEAAPPLAIIFIETDANGDGELSAAEFDRVLLILPDGTAVR